MRRGTVSYFTWSGVMTFTNPHIILLAGAMFFGAVGFALWSVALLLKTLSDLRRKSGDV